jgi:prepilin-type N-terminal cleavage/methylation domain-containing protein
MKLNKTKGFTLVELLGVVAIIAVLATVSITSISGAVQGGRVASSKRQIQSLNSAYQNYLAAGGSAQGATVTSAFDALVNKVQLPESTQEVGPFLLSRPLTTVKSASGGDVPLTFDVDRGFDAAGGAANLEN